MDTTKPAGSSEMSKPDTSKPTPSPDAPKPDTSAIDPSGTRGSFPHAHDLLDRVHDRFRGDDNVPRFEEVSSIPPAVPTRAADMLIRHEPDGAYRLYAPYTMRLLGTDATRAEAEQRARGIELAAAAAAPPGPVVGGESDEESAYHQRRAGLAPADEAADRAFMATLEDEKAFAARRANRLPPDPAADQRVLEGRRQRLERVRTLGQQVVAAAVTAAAHAKSDTGRVNAEADATRDAESRGRRFGATVQAP